MQTMRAILVTLFLAVGLVGPAAAGPLEDSQAAYNKGDYATALRLVRPLADQGNAAAQYNLGLMYSIGQGVPQDYVQAHKWLNLGALDGDKDAIKSRDIVAGKMTPAQIAEAQKLAREWMEKHQ